MQTEDLEAAEATDPPAADLASQGLRRIPITGNTAIAGPAVDGLDIGGIAPQVDAEDRGHPVDERRIQRRHRELMVRRIDIAEHRLQPAPAQALRGGHKRETRYQHFVAEFERLGGGWTLALKSDGNTNTFAWNSPHWFSPDPFQPEFPDLDRNEAKLASYAKVPFDEVLVVFEEPIGVDPAPLTPLAISLPTSAGSRFLKNAKSCGRVHLRRFTIAPASSMQTR